jgi:sulfatase maturation enzyme AslB (radical SAM superfamily)
MHCPRLDHFVRFNPTGTVGRCGHMVEAPEFNSLEEMDSSLWLLTVKKEFAKDLWPKECARCMQTESINGSSIRLNAIKFDQIQKQKDYLTVGGVLDNICNSACLTCNENLSTLIGGLKSKVYPIIDNSNKFWQLPLDRVVHLDINGGEPSHSKNYKHILANLPKNIKSVRLNTNCSTVLDELLPLAARGVDITVTVSLDGIGAVHDFVRWPIKWKKFYKNLMTYKAMPVKLNLWTTVSVLNVDDLPNIIAFAQEHDIDHSYAYLKEPVELDVENKGTSESLAYIQKQKQLRGLE